jgi:hypothetical protein
MSCIPSRIARSCFVLALVPLAHSHASAQAPGSAPRLAPDGVTRIEGAVREPAHDASPLRGTASDLIYFEEDGGGGGPRGLYDLTSSTGVSSLRVTVGGSERLFGLATHPTGGTVYGVDPLRNDIFTVDVTTGAVAFVVSLNGVSTVADITFDPATGQLYGAERNSPLRLYTIDLATGNVVTIGQMPNVRSGLTFAPNGLLYGFALDGTLYRVDKTTAAETLIGGGGGPGLTEDATARSDGALFLTDFDGDLFQVDPTTGASTFVGNSGSGNGLLGIIPTGSGGGGCPTTVAAVETVRLGTPPNPAALLPGLTSGPVIGATWDPVIDHTSFFPASVADLMSVNVLPTNLFIGFGTLLCDLTSPGVIVSAVPGNPFSVPIPGDCSIVGVSFCAQAASFDVAGGYGLTNALDITLGTF